MRGAHINAESKTTYNTTDAKTLIIPLSILYIYIPRIFPFIKNNKQKLSTDLTFKNYNVKGAIGVMKICRSQKIKGADSKWRQIETCTDQTENWRRAIMASLRYFF